MPRTFKIPESVLVVIYTPTWDVLLIRRTDEDPLAPAFWQSVTGGKDTVQETFQAAAIREVQEETGIGCDLDSDQGPVLHWRTCTPSTPAGCTATRPGCALTPNTFLACKYLPARRCGSTHRNTRITSGCPTSKPQRAAFHRPTPRPAPCCPASQARGVQHDQALAGGELQHPQGRARHRPGAPIGNSQSGTGYGAL